MLASIHSSQFINMTRGWSSSGRDGMACGCRSVSACHSDSVGSVNKHRSGVCAYLCDWSSLWVWIWTRTWKSLGCVCSWDYTRHVCSQGLSLSSSLLLNPIRLEQLWGLAVSHATANWFLSHCCLVMSQCLLYLYVFLLFACGDKI